MTFESRCDQTPLTSWDFANTRWSIAIVSHDACPDPVDFCATVFPTVEVGLHVIFEILGGGGDKGGVVHDVVPFGAVSFKEC